MILINKVAIITIMTGISKFQGGQIIDVREANINVVGDWRMPLLGELNENAISAEEIRETVN